MFRMSTRINHLMKPESHLFHSQIEVMWTKKIYGIHTNYGIYMRTPI